MPIHTWFAMFPCDPWCHSTRETAEGSVFIKMSPTWRLDTASEGQLVMPVVLNCFCHSSLWNSNILLFRTTCICKTKQVCKRWNKAQSPISKSYSEVTFESPLVTLCCEIRCSDSRLVWKLFGMAQPKRIKPIEKYECGYIFSIFF